MLSHLMSFRQTDGGFGHMNGLGSNGMATEQALLGLLAYKDFANKGPFRALSSRSIEGYR